MHVALPMALLLTGFALDVIELGSLMLTVAVFSVSPKKTRVRGLCSAARQCRFLLGIAVDAGVKGSA
jgi:hypothetical protein